MGRYYLDRVHHGDLEKVALCEHFIVNVLFSFKSVLVFFIFSFSFDFSFVFLVVILNLDQLSVNFFIYTDLRLAS